MNYIEPPQEAICQHALYYALWLRYGGLPERYNWKSDSPDVRFYPLRPEFVEATYFLYRATGAPFYLHVGRDVIKSLENHTRTNCGYATVHDVLDKSLEDRSDEMANIFSLISTNATIGQKNK